MRTVTITRFDTGYDGTFGTLKTDCDFDFECVTIELPWRDNHADLSCIPLGSYLCEYAESPKFHQCYHLREVPGRTDILIHPGNWGGDVSKGFRASVKGCIALGEHFRRIRGQKGVDNSVETLERFEAAMSFQPFVLTIR